MKRSFGWVLVLTLLSAIAPQILVVQMASSSQTVRSWPTSVGNLTHDRYLRGIDADISTPQSVLTPNRQQGVAFYVDPDCTGDVQDGSAAHPWSTLRSSEWSVIDGALASSDVTVYFSAREADVDVDESGTSAVPIYRGDTSTNRVTLDGMSRYNTDDANPAWSDYSGSSRHEIRGGYTVPTGQQKRNYVTIRGFRIIAGVGGYGGQAINYWGGDHVIIEHNDLTHDPSVDHGATLQFGYAHQQDGGGNGGCTDIIIRHNVVHDTCGECIYIGGSEDTGLPAHSNVLIEGNTTYNCGIYGGQGDCIDPKDEITDLVIRNNYCHNGYGISNVNGIPSSSPMLAEGNIIHDIPGKGISLGTYWGRGIPGSVIKNNLIFDNGVDGIYLNTDTTSKPMTEIHILNNTIYNNGRNGILVGSYADAITDLWVANNIIVGNLEGIGGWGTPTYVISHNDLYENNVNYAGPFPDLTGVDGNISVDPRFASVAGANFHLLPNSSVIDTGEALAQVDIDLDGISRPQGGGWDMGAYEFVPSLVLQGAPANQAIHLNWTINSTLPVTSTWQIDYEGPVGDQTPPITGIVNPTRVYSLTGLTNYVWYTVTLNAMLDSSLFLTDTVRVMPTDIAVYLPLVLKAP